MPIQISAATKANYNKFIDFAKTLYYKGHVVSAESWNDHDKQREIAGPVPPNRANGWYDDVVTIGSSSKARSYIGLRILHLTEGYFRRNIMRAIAKPGWFAEDWREE